MTFKDLMGKVTGLFKSKPYQQEVDELLAQISQNSSRLGTNRFFPTCVNDEHRTVCPDAYECFRCELDTYMTWITLTSGLGTIYVPSSAQLTAGMLQQSAQLGAMQSYYSQARMSGIHQQLQQHIYSSTQIAQQQASLANVFGSVGSILTYRPNCHTIISNPITGVKKK